MGGGGALSLLPTAGLKSTTSAATSTWKYGKYGLTMAYRVNTFTMSASKWDYYTRAAVKIACGSFELSGDSHGLSAHLDVQDPHVVVGQQNTAQVFIVPASQMSREI